jgi:hypothetical protein
LEPNQLGLSRTIFDKKAFFPDFLLSSCFQIRDCSTLAIVALPSRPSIFSAFLKFNRTLGIANAEE